MKSIMRKKINLLFTLLLVIVFTGCEEYLDINDDPNNPTVAPIQGLLSNATFETGNNMFRTGNITSYYVQYLASPNPGGATDTHEPTSYGDAWFQLYDVMTDIADLEILATEAGAANYLGVAQILKALNLGLTVDMWGEVPFSEAFFAQTLTPAYDDDAALYQDVLQLLSDGISNLESGVTGVTMGDDDFIYGGDIDKWIKLGYTLQARYLNHLTKTGNYNPGDVLSAVENGFESNEDDASVTYFDIEINPWADEAIDNANLLLGGWISEQTVEALDGSIYGVEDPRMPYLFGPNDDGEFIGTENGAGRGDAPEQGARSVLVEGEYYTSRTSPILISTYAELKMIEAEAAFRNNNPDRAYEAYLEGIEAHMDMLGLSDDEKEGYLTDPAVAVGSGDLTIDDIFREKYVVMFLNPEAWADARRYDYQYEDMTLPANHNPDLNGQFIRRLAYPDSEVTRNARSIPSGVTLATPIFWDE